MTDQRLPKLKTDSSAPETRPGAVPAQTSQTPQEESVTFEPKRTPTALPEVHDDEPEADAQHEKTLDIDSELSGGAPTDVPIVVVSPLVAPPHKQPSLQTPVPPPAPNTPLGFVQMKQQAVPAHKDVVLASDPPRPPEHLVVPPPMPPRNPETTSAARLPKEEAPPLSLVRTPRSFASITPLVMQTPVEPVLTQSPSSSLSEGEVPTPATPPDDLHAPIPIVQDIPGSPTPPPGTVTKQPSLQVEPTVEEKPEEPKKMSVLEQLRAQTASVLHPLRTYQTDAQVRIHESNESLVSVAAAEENRKARAQLMVRPAFKAVVSPAPQHHYVRTVLLVLGIALFLAAGIGAVAYVLIPKTVDITGQQLATSRPIEVDESIELQFGGLTHDQLLQLLSDLRDKTGLSLGLMREIYFTLPTDTGDKRLATIHEVLPRLAPHAPQELLRTLNAPFLVGVHVYDGNQGFIILKTNAYEQAYSAMLAWEPVMRQDLLPFLDRREGPKLVSEIVPTTTPAKVINSAFVDAVLKNHDTRALYNDVGDVIFLYSFLDRNTIIITTNDRTLGEAISRTNR